MAMPWVQTVGAASVAGGQSWYSADFMQSPFDAVYSVEGTSSIVSATYNVETTLDDVNVVASPEVFTVVSGTADATGGLPFCRFARINVTTGPVGGSITFRILQGMSSR
jgi:hypothetical protein